MYKIIIISLRFKNGLSRYIIIIIDTIRYLIQSDSHTYYHIQSYDIILNINLKKKKNSLNVYYYKNCFHFCV